MSDFFSLGGPGIFLPIVETLLADGDRYMDLADLNAYVETQRHVAELYRKPGDLTCFAIINVGSSGKFSNDRTIAGYARDLRTVKPCPAL